MKFIINENKDFWKYKASAAESKDYTIKALQNRLTRWRNPETSEEIDCCLPGANWSWQASIENNNADAKYKVSDSSSSTGNSNAQSDISTQRDNIKTSRKNIKKIDQQIDLYQQQIKDVQSLW